MTKQEAKHLSDILKAYSEGKELEIKNSFGEWIHLCENPYFTDAPMNYRIKPEPKLRPYANAEEIDEAIKQHGAWIKNKKSNKRFMIVFYNNEEIGYINNTDGFMCNFRTKDYISECVWVDDGSPCGIIEE